MPADKAPAFQFYPKDFLSSDAVSLMTTEQIGAYTLLLCHSWLRPEGLPSDLSSLAKLARVPVARFTAKVWPGLCHCFHTQEDGLLYNPRMERGRYEQDLYRAERSQSGKRGAATRWGMAQPSNGNGSAIKEPMAKYSSSSASASAVQEPPVPPSDEGGRRITRAEVKSAEAVRRNARSGCWHEPKCENYATCVRLIALESRARVSV